MDLKDNKTTFKQLKTILTKGDEYFTTVDKQEAFKDALTNIYVNLDEIIHLIFDNTKKTSKNKPHYRKLLLKALLNNLPANKHQRPKTDTRDPSRSNLKGLKESKIVNKFDKAIAQIHNQVTHVKN